MLYSLLNQLADSRTFLMSVFHPCPIVHIHRISIETTNLMTVLMVLEEEPSTTGDWVFTSSFAESYSFLDVIRDSIFCVDWICIIDVIGITTTSERDLIVIQIENEVEVVITFQRRNARRQRWLVGRQSGWLRTLVRLITQATCIRAVCPDRHF